MSPAISVETIPPIHFLLAAFPPAISLPGMVVCDKAPFGGSSMGNKNSSCFI